MIQRAVFAVSLLMFCTIALGADEPKWLKDARAREAKAMKPVELKSKDGVFKARIPAKLVGTIEKVGRLLLRRTQHGRRSVRSL